MSDEIHESLKTAEADTLASYRAFVGQAAPEDAKGFAAHHAACKAALAHLEALLKLVRTLEKEPPFEAPQAPTVSDQLAAARAAAGLNDQPNEQEEE